MKTNHLIFTVFLSLFIVLSCSSDDDSNGDNPPAQSENHPIVGKWSLIQLIGGFSPTSHFNLNEIVWEFKADHTMIVSIEENIQPAQNDTFTSQFLGLNYSYDVNDTEDVITFISTDFPNHPQTMNYEIVGDSLYLDTNVASDGVSRLFVKIKD